MLFTFVHWWVNPTRQKCQGERGRERDKKESERQPTANQIRKLYSFVVDACVKNPHRNLKLYRISCLREEGAQL